MENVLAIGSCGKISWSHKNVNEIVKDIDTATSLFLNKESCTVLICQEVFINLGYNVRVIAEMCNPKVSIEFSNIRKEIMIVKNKKEKHWWYGIEVDDGGLSGVGSLSLPVKCGCKQIFPVYTAAQINKARELTYYNNDEGQNEEFMANLEKVRKQELRRLAKLGHKDITTSIILEVTEEK